MRSSRISSLLARRCLNGGRYVTNMPQEFQDRFTMEADVEKELVVDEIWIKSETALRAMKLGKKEPTKHIESMEMGHHIIARNYESADNPDESCRRVISSCMTFPLTLGYAHKLLLPAVPSRPNILMIGARAESSLPSVWWKDCLYNNGALESASIKMTGPGIKKRPEKHAALTDTTEMPSDVEILEWKVPQLDHPVSDSSSESSYFQISLSSPHNENNMKLLHENSDAMQLLLWADIFVLYNPGLGSKALKSKWDPTIRMLLDTRKPIVCTAHGDTDLGNDLNYLNRISQEEDSQDMGEPIEFLIPPHLNPFRSLKRVIDKEAEEFSDDRIVTTNCYLYALRSK